MSYLTIMKGVLKELLTGGRPHSNSKVAWPALFGSLGSLGSLGSCLGRFWWVWQVLYAVWLYSDESSVLPAAVRPFELNLGANEDLEVVLWANDMI